jgi:ABC-type uncharacterized transport system permease subunit
VTRSPAKRSASRVRSYPGKYRETETDFSVTLAALLVLVALPLLFIILQAIFPILAPVRWRARLAAWRR